MYYAMKKEIWFGHYTMNKIYWILVCLVLTAGPAAAIGKKDVRAAIEEAYRGAKITEIEKEKYRERRSTKSTSNMTARILKPSLVSKVKSSRSVSTIKA